MAVRLSKRSSETAEPRTRLLILTSYHIGISSDQLSLLLLVASFHLSSELAASGNLQRSLLILSGREVYYNGS